MLWDTARLTVSRSECTIGPEAPQRPFEQIRRVAHAIEPVTALVDEHGIRAVGQPQTRLVVRQENAVGGGRGPAVDADLQRDLPALGRRRRRGLAFGRRGQVGEALLRDHEIAAVEPRGDEREARMEDEAIHHHRDRLAGCTAERRPQVSGVGVVVQVHAEIVAHAGAEDVGAEVLLEHAEH